jgi:D-aminopeptidase
MLANLLTFSASLNCAAADTAAAGPARAPELGVHPGAFESGLNDAITDVPGVKVGHFTLDEGERVKTGVTAIVPHDGNLFQEKVPAAIVVGNGFGKLVGYTQVRELGQLETPILLTNTLAVWDAASALVEQGLSQPGNEDVRSINPVVGETNDGYLSDIRARPLQREHFLAALKDAKTGPVAEGSVGAGTGTRALGFKGGIGTASRKVDGHTVGVLVQSNFGGELSIDGVRVGQRLQQNGEPDRAGSCMIVVATDAPVDARQLRRLAARALAGMARTGASFSNGSGDYVIAFSTAKGLRIRVGQAAAAHEVMDDGDLSPLFSAAADSTEEAIYNSLLSATTVKGRDGHTASAIPVGEVRRLLKKR